MKVSQDPESHRHMQSFSQRTLSASTFTKADPMSRIHFAHSNNYININYDQYLEEQIKGVAICILKVQICFCLA